MDTDKYCIKCDWIPKSEKAIYCELCGSTLLLFADRYCDLGCEISPSADDKFCSKCGNDLFPISKNRICSEADCDRTIPQDQLIQLFYDYKNQYSEWQDDFEIPLLCIPHLFQSKNYADWYCKFDMCRNTADSGPPKFASDLCLEHFMDLPKLKKCKGPVCDEYYFDPYGIPEIMLGNEIPRIYCYHCWKDELNRFIEEYDKTYYELKILYEKHNKDLTRIRINGDSMVGSIVEFIVPDTSRTLSFMKAEIYKLTDQSPPYEVCIRCGKDNIPTVAEYCMVCLRSTKEYADHWFEKLEKLEKRKTDTIDTSGGGFCGTSMLELEYEQDKYSCVGRCGLCFDESCEHNKDYGNFNWTPKWKMGKEIL